LEFLFGLAVALAAINSILLIALASVYGRTALHTHAAYPFGLFFFSMLLLLQNVGTAFGYLFDSSFIGDAAYPFMSLVGAFELAGLLALLRITV
jgi:hypothetical protein